jgi:transposase
MKEPMKTETKPKPTRHDEAFRQQAVRMWKQSGKSGELTARELGISVFQLYDWNRAGQPTRAAGWAPPPESKESLQAENERLRHELARITEQRDILKKAAGILSEPSQSGMPGLKR